MTQGFWLAQGSDSDIALMFVSSDMGFQCYRRRVFFDLSRFG